MSEEKEIVEVVSKLYKTFKKVGVKNVMTALEKLCRSGINNYDQKVIDFIKNKVCLSFNVNPSDLNKSFLSSELFTSRSMVMVLVKKHLNLSHLEVSNLFDNKNHSIVSHALTDFKNKNEKIKEHKIYLDYYKAIDIDIEIYKQKISE
jgi:chromosomal replication initiation ATPase DnaA